MPNLCLLNILTIAYTPDLNILLKTVSYGKAVSSYKYKCE